MLVSVVVALACGRSAPPAAFEASPGAAVAGPASDEASRASKAAATPPKAESRRSAPMEYRLSPVFEDEALVALAVELRFSGDDSGTTRVQLPERWASERELWRYVRDVEVEGARTVSEDGPAVRVIEAEPGAALRMRYRVVSAYDREPRADDGQPFAPVIRPEWFYAFGEAVFAVPGDDYDPPARFSWTGAPDGFGFASDLLHLEQGGGMVGDVHESIVMGGRGLVRRTEPVGGAPLHVAVRGEFPFTEDAFVDMARTIVQIERALWGEGEEPFTIVLAPLEAMEGRRSLGGTGRSDAFALTVAQDTSIEFLRHLLAHEYFHTWNPRRLGGSPEGDAEMQGKWFDEGFTELYTWRLLLRGGLYQLEDFVHDWNEALRKYATSPVRNEPNARIVADYWNDPDVGDLPYLRGPQLGAIWEQRLRQATGGARGLDDVLLAMRAGHREIEEASSKAPTAAERFVASYAELGGPDLEADLERFIERGETIRLPVDVFGGCVRVVTDAESQVQRLEIGRGMSGMEREDCENVVSGRGSSVRPSQ